MNELRDKDEKYEINRRDFVKRATALSPFLVYPSVGFSGGIISQNEQKVRVGIIGCGGRGMADLINCLNSAPNVELVAMGDLFEDQLNASFENLTRQVPDKMNVPQKNKFVGFDAYKGVLTCDLDLVLLTAPPVFRPQHVKAAVDANKHIFMEKPIAVDPVGVREVIATCEVAEKKGLTVLGGTQMRKATHIAEAMGIIHNGEIGELVGGQCCRLGGAMRTWGPQERLSEWSNMEWQLRNWYFYTWTGGDFITEMHIHNLDLMNWAFNSHPTGCTGFGGRQARTGPTTGKWGNIYDHFAVEYLYPGDVRVQYIGTQIDNAAGRNDQHLVGTKGSVYVDFSRAIIKGAKGTRELKSSGDPSIKQHALQIEAIRKGKKLNDGKQVAESTLTTIMGQMSCYTGKTIDWEWILKKSQTSLTPATFRFDNLPFPDVAIPGVTPLV